VHFDGGYKILKCLNINLCKFFFLYRRLAFVHVHLVHVFIVSLLLQALLAEHGGADTKVGKNGEGGSAVRKADQDGDSGQYV
jgi:hypothetical protein